MEILDGKKIAGDILERIRLEIEQLSFAPIFCDVLVGNDPASAQYVKMKARTAEKVGIKFRSANYPNNISTTELISEIKKISQEPNMCGMIVQLPLPAGLEKQAILDAIDAKIDVDCTGKINTDLFFLGRSYVDFPTASAVMEILDNTKVDLKNKNCLVVGFGQLVGRPVSFLLQQRGYRVTVARSKTPNIPELLKEADVIISAVGKPRLITGDKIKSGCIVIDAGTAEGEGGIVGDVDYESVKDKADFISPVPGGVGPVTVAKLLFNVLKVAKTF